MELLELKFKSLLGHSIFEYVIFGNTLADYTFASVALVVLLVVLKSIQWFILHRLRKFAEKTTTDIDDALIRIVKTVRPSFYFFVAFYITVNFFLSFSERVTSFIAVILIVWLVYQAIKALQVLIDFVVHKAMGKEDDEGAKSAADLVGKISKIALWAIGFILILSNLGVNVNSLIAGLGIGGIAIAFALQKILGDLFSSFAIYFDKPFIIGDFIVVGEDMGTVERIGIKTTRLRSLQGEEIVISNQELTSVRVQNFKKMDDRRVVFHFGVVYETPSDKLKKIPEVVGKIIEGVENVRLDRVHFSKFDDSALTFEAVYYVNSADYNEYMDRQQDINFKIKDEFEKMGVSMAYPTRTLYIASNENA
jgi:small-conductance mechanosensitive channel